jgi:hypothetical protein
MPSTSRVTPFSFEHTFRASSIDEVFSAYFDPGLQSEADRRVEIIERTVLEHEETGSTVRRVCRVVPRRQLPAFVRPLVSGTLHYIETARWRRQDQEIDIQIRPSVLGGRALITALYRLSRAGSGLIHRRYSGAVSVDVALFSSRIERGIVADFERSIPITAACTQAWLERSARSVSAQA